MVGVIERSLRKPLVRLDQGQLLLLPKKTQRHTGMVDRILIQHHSDRDIPTGHFVRLDGKYESLSNDEGASFPFESKRGGFLLGAIALQLGALQGEAAFEIDPGDDVVDPLPQVIAFKPGIAGRAFRDIRPQLVHHCAEQGPFEVRIGEVHAINADLRGL